MKDRIFIVTHKEIKKKINKKGYSYIQVNTKNNSNLNFEFNDFDGENISEKNPNFCELTALYWIWKNYKTDNNSIIGLCHYRRFFSKAKILILPSINYFKKVLNDYDIIVPKKFLFNNSTYENYFLNGCGKEKDLINVGKIIKNMYPDYSDAFKEFCESNNGHYCNMMICRKELLNEYSTWLFNILFELEKQTDLSSYTKEEARIYGYLSELLLNVYIKKNNLKYKELYVVNTDISLIMKIKNKLRRI